MKRSFEEHPPSEVPYSLQCWRHTEQEDAFIQGWIRLQMPELWVCLAGRYHAASFVCHTRAREFFARLRACRIHPRDDLLPLGETETQSIESHLWAFFQAGKLLLDALAREVNLIYWHRDGAGLFDDPLTKARWISFYTVRQKLLAHDQFAREPISQLLARHTTGETADPPYQALSHWANVGLMVPLLIGPVVSDVAPSDQSPSVGQCRILLPDDPRQFPTTYDRGFEINALGTSILAWLAWFMDEVYRALTFTLTQMKGAE